MTTLFETDAEMCAALFASVQQPSDKLGRETVREAISRAISEFGVNGCTERVAEEFGDHPDMAVARMRWARAVVEQTFTEEQH